MKEYNNLITDLALLESHVLANFIASLYGEDEILDKRIERLLLKKDIPALFETLKKEIKSLRRGRHYYSYYETSELANKIYGLQKDIESSVMPVSPDQAFQLFNDLLATAENSLNRCDDSDGYIGDIYRDICLLWLKAASQSAVPAKGWMPVVRKLVEDNEYGILDPILPNASMLLTEDELRQLADYYEDKLRTSLKKRDEETFDHGIWSAHLHGIAESLKDPALFIQTTLLLSPSPDYRQKESIIRFCIHCGAYDEAMKWLQGKWGNDDWARPEATRLALLADCYQALEQHDNYLKTLIELLDVKPDYATLLRTLALVSDNEAQQLRDKFIMSVLKEPELYDQLNPLLKLHEYGKAEELAIKGIHEVAEWHYTQLLSLLDDVPANEHILRVILFRSLTDDILAGGRTQAYHHAASYLQQLDQLDNEIKTYSALPDHAIYMGKVKEKHGRKYSFWAKYNPQ